MKVAVTAANGQLGRRIMELGLPLGRLKTGTPPRLCGKSIDWSAIGTQPGDDDPAFFSFLTSKTENRQISCGVTETNAKTHDIIKKNINRSAMYGGHIEGVGPRYCPSIEDKVTRFGEKSSHQIFLEPESLSDDVIYPNGISTSLPEDVQSALKGILLDSQRANLTKRFESEEIRAMIAAWGPHLDHAPDIAGGCFFPFLETNMDLLQIHWVCTLTF